MNHLSKDYGENYNIEHPPFLSLGSKTDSLATGQTGDDIFCSTPINPDLDDPEELTGEPIQYFLTLVVQLQWLVVLGRLVTHAQVTTLPKLMVA